MRASPVFSAHRIEHRFEFHLLARLKHAGTDDAFGVHENVRAAIIRFDESKPAMLVPSAAVALNSLAETTSKRSRQILLPHNASRSDVRPEQFERRARLVSAIARGRRWLDDVVSGRVTTVAQLCTR